MAIEKTSESSSTSENDAEQSNVTIVDDDGGLGEMMALGLIEEGESSGRTKQVSMEDRGMSPIVNIPVTTHEQATSPIGNEKGTTILVQDQTDTNDTVIQDQSAGLLQELSMHIKGETDEDDVNGVLMIRSCRV
ncbi:11692_t:CDS:2 [Diversispora eburnea]|uniref:11692_t:CDS:1 n=1 Tax=Diversispora eburnea TaxID=1213867 RepID=A0A9N9GHT7_9GLOM|nr:11692_t:CDS:2 [Diversispora eburnea]